MKGIICRTPADCRRGPLCAVCRDNERRRVRGFAAIVTAEIIDGIREIAEEMGCQEMAEVLAEWRRRRRGEA